MQYLKHFSDMDMIDPEVYILGNFREAGPRCKQKVNIAIKMSKAGKKAVYTNSSKKHSQTKNGKLSFVYVMMIFY
jgi:hypothetical protein